MYLFIVSSAVIIGSLGSGTCDWKLREQSETDEPNLIFEEPVRIRKIRPEPVPLRAGAILAEERYTVSPLRKSNTSDVVADGKTIAPANSTFLIYRWQGSTWACRQRTSHSELKVRPFGTGVCLRDSSGGGSFDRALDGVKEFPIEPLTLVPAPPLKPWSSDSVRVRLMVKATSIKGHTLRFDGEAEIELGGIPYFRYTIPEDPKGHRVDRLSDGAELWIGSIRLRVQTNPVLSTKAAGHFRPVTLCPGNSAVLVGGSITSSTAMPKHVN